MVSSIGCRKRKEPGIARLFDLQAAVYLLLLLPVVFFSPPWAERLLLAPPAALALAGDLPEAGALRPGEEADDWVADFMAAP
jgi:hypothetical protein